jgi:hypothetical protein
MLNIVNHYLNTKKRSSIQLSKQKPRKKISTTLVLAIIGFVLVGSTAGYAWINSLIPVNGKVPVFGFAENIFITTKRTDQGFVFASQSSGKKSISPIHVSPKVFLSKGQLATVRIMNEDKTSKHNFNVDEFSIHSHDLGYFEPQAITFVADKTGTFQYHCTIHPEMRGEITIQ